MVMDNQLFINVVGGLILTGVGWWCREIWDAVSKLREDIKEIEVDLPSNYQKKADVNIRLDKIENVLAKIFDKLERKMDK